MSGRDGVGVVVDKQNLFEGNCDKEVPRMYYKCHALFYKDAS